MDGSLVKNVPRKEDFFFSFGSCVVLGVVEHRAEGEVGAAREDDMDKPGDRGPLSRLDSEVIMVEVVKVVEVVVVKDVPVVLVDRRELGGKEFPNERCGSRGVY